MDQGKNTTTQQQQQQQNYRHVVALRCEWFQLWVPFKPHPDAPRLVSVKIFRPPHVSKLCVSAVLPVCTRWSADDGGRAQLGTLPSRPPSQAPNNSGKQVVFAYVQNKHKRAIYASQKNSTCPNTEHNLSSAQIPSPNNEI